MACALIAQMGPGSRISSSTCSRIRPARKGPYKAKNTKIKPPVIPSTGDMSIEFRGLAVGLRAFSDVEDVPVWMKAMQAEYEDEDILDRSWTDD